jgi:hypothetical protein
MGLTSMNSEQLSLDLSTSVTYLKLVQWIGVAYQKRNEWFPVVDVKPVVPHTSGRLGGHGG